jgi:hypothetical protein
MENSIKEKIEKFKKETVKMMQKTLSRQGGLDPLISILVDKEIDGKLGIVIMPMPDDTLESDENKRILTDVIIPQVFKKLKETDMNPICISWSAEAWVRKAPKSGGVPEDWKSLPKTEALIITFENEEGSEIEVFSMIREGKMANEDGDIIDCIRLEKDETLNKGKDTVMSNAGMFTNLFKKGNG